MEFRATARNSIHQTEPFLSAEGLYSKEPIANVIKSTGFATRLPQNHTKGSHITKFVHACQKRQSLLLSAALEKKMMSTGASITVVEGLDHVYKHR